MEEKKSVMSKIKEKAANVGNFTKEHIGEISIIGSTVVGIVLIELTYKKYCDQRLENYTHWINHLEDLYTRKLETLTSKEEFDNFVEADEEAVRYAIEEVTSKK